MALFGFPFPSVFPPKTVFSGFKHNEMTHKKGGPPKMRTARSLINSVFYSLTTSKATSTVTSLCNFSVATYEPTSFTGSFSTITLRSTV